MTEKTLAKGYEPKDVEARWRAYWEENRTFTPDADAPGEPYAIVIPPPNVTGALHIGHALNITIQDMLCRFMRQQGKKVLWVPGMDHAGIATQNVVERKLKSEGLSREDLGREKFIERVWQWKEEFGGKILNQIRRLGASVDWTRQRFTMDEGLSAAVREVFVSLYEQGLVYKGEYIVNWCTRCHTALADDEVEHAAKKGQLFHIRYPLADGSGHLVVATTRPETMLGDTAVAVNPEDERYAHLIGKKAILPLVGRELPIIGDPYVDMKFGTGCLKVTPAHDMNDWDLGKKHNLPILSVMDDDGNMTAEAGPRYMGLSIEGCRRQIIADLTEGGHLLKIEEHDHKVGECYRCKTVIEPHVSMQWFVAVKPLAEKAMAAVQVGETKIFPETWAKVYFQWLENVRDWCISRQLWWGHRIPVWYCGQCGKTLVSREDPTSCPCGGELTRDEDVLDTWFSSALWPFSTLGWPEKTKDLETFYPTSVLVTAFDILFFWVARMMMMGLHFQGDVPFKHVYIHALVRDEEGRKMSKSTGNVIDPLEMIERYGCDALRFTLAAFAAMGRDIKLSEARIEGYRHFVNKLWNAARFTLMNLDGEKPGAEISAARGLPHRWVLSRLEGVKAEVHAAISGYNFNDAAQALYGFIWKEFCDWYLEMAKPELSGEDQGAREAARAVLWTVLTETLTLLHPIMPFVTQEIWAALPGTPGEDLALTPYPAWRPEARDAAVETEMALLQEAIVAIRNIRGELNIAPSVSLTAIFRTAEPAHAETLTTYAPLVRLLAKVGEVTVGASVQAPKAAATAVVQGVELFVPLAGAVDFEAELARMDKELAKVAKDVDMVSRKLANEDFVAKAPAEVVGKEREKLAGLKEKQAKLTALKDRLKSVMG
jgi:valyl-tRNA synthetase